MPQLGHDLEISMPLLWTQSYKLSMSQLGHNLEISIPQLLQDCKMNSMKTDKFTLFVYCKFLVLLKVQPYAVKK